VSYRINPPVAPLVCAVLLGVQTMTCPALSEGFVPTIIREGAPERLFEMRPALPDIHFWTSAQGRPELDCRLLSSGIGIEATANAAFAPNMYSGAANNGDWRGFTALATPDASISNNGDVVNLGPSLAPEILALERQAINQDDALAAAGKSPIDHIELSGSGISWGTEATETPQQLPRHFWSRMPNRETSRHCSYLKGPVRLTADYIRLDGPISRIGADVTLNARRIVINGVELPPSEWRQALTKIVQSPARP
jgi:hypothetical protein